MENPLIIVDDDQDDISLIRDAAEQLNITRPIQYLMNGNELISYLSSSNEVPFLIICDVNLPGEDGFEVKKRIENHPELRYKTVPFIYWSTQSSPKQIQYAYDLPAQGFFFKPQSFNDLCETLRTILGYWSISQHPKEVK